MPPGQYRPASQGVQSLASTLPRMVEKDPSVHSVGEDEPAGQ